MVKVKEAMPLHLWLRMQARRDRAAADARVQEEAAWAGTVQREVPAATRDEALRVAARIVARKDRPR